MNESPIVMSGLVAKLITCVCMLASMAFCVALSLPSFPEPAYAQQLTTQAYQRSIGSATFVFDANGGVFDNGAQLYSYGTASLVSSSSYSASSGKLADDFLGTMGSRVSRPGWSFAGWYNSSSGGYKYSSSDVFSKGGSYTLYAHWKCDEYTAVYELNGGEVGEGVSLLFANVPKDTPYNQIPKPSSDPVRDGYTFSGWANAFNTTYSDEDVPLLYEGETEISFFATWKVKQFTASFDANGGAFPTGETITNSAAVDVGTSLSEVGYPTEAPTRPGYTFNGWWDDKERGAGVSASTIPEFGVNESNTKTYYAHWIGNASKAVFDANGGAIEGESTVEIDVVCGNTIDWVPANPIRDHYSFAGWFDAETDGAKVGKDTVFETPGTIYYAHWVPDIYEVQFVDSGGESLECQFVEYGQTAEQPKAPAADSSYVDTASYVFDGWRVGGSDGPVYSFDEPVTSNLYLYASWRPPHGTIHFDANGGKGKMSDLESENGYVDLPYCAFTRSGYSCSGWSEDKKATTPSLYEGEDLGYNFSADQDGKTVTLYAIWSKDEVYDEPEYEDEDYYYGPTPEEAWKDQFKSVGVKTIRYGNKAVSGGIWDSSGYYRGEYDCDPSEVGSTYVKGAVVKVKVAGKTYKGKMKSNGTFKVNTPKLANCKVGAKVKITISQKKKTRTITKKVATSAPSISSSKVYQVKPKPTITVKGLVKGDTVQVKVGGKTHKKIIKKNTKKLTWKPKISKAKAGSKMSITVLNKYKQKLASKNVKIYYASAIKKGMTKAQVRLVPGYGSPDGKSSGGRFTYYTYNWTNESETILFDNGKVYEISSYSW